MAVETPTAQNSGEAVGLAPIAPPRRESVLLAARQLAHELHPARSVASLGSDASLERDFGLDSLARMELLARLEKELGLVLPEELLATAESPRDLDRALARRPHATPAARAPAVSACVGPAEAAPESCATLLEVLDWHLTRHAGRRHVLFVPGSGPAEELAYAGLAERSEKVASALAELRLTASGRVGIMLPTGLDYFSVFFGVLHASGIPVPLYPPTRPSQIEEHLRRHAKILRTAGAEILVTSPEVTAVAQLLRARVDTLRHVVAPAALRPNARALRAGKARPADIALLQFTSGSTGDPKGVMVTHANLLANVRAMGRAGAVAGNDSVVSWLPLYHDMGLAGAWIGSLYFGLPLTVMSPLTFLARPVRWLRTIAEQRATISASPNFGYELCLTKITDEELVGLDLSSWRLALNGAEPVSPDTLLRFGERFAANGFRANALAPVYGLAESCVGLTFPPPGRMPRIDPVKRDRFTATGEAVPAAADDPLPLRFVGCGFPLPGHEVRIVDDAGRETGERRQGRLEFQGPSSTAGYFHDPKRTGELFHDGWLDSGDLAYSAEGEIFVTGRAKDIVIRGGRNLYPEELEGAVGQVPGIRKGCVAVFGAPEPRTGTERVVVLAETREQRPAERERLRQEVEELTIELLGMPADEVTLVPPHSVLKTSSGKLRRAASREAYLAGRLGPSMAPLWWQLVRFTAASVGPALRRLGARAAALAYASWFWLAAGLAASVGWPVLVLLPRRDSRRRLARRLARALAALVGVKIDTEGLEHFHGLDRWVVVVNHQSYLDAFVLTAVLPAIETFVVKRELAGPPITALPLERLGSLFVERVDPHAGVEDTRVITAAVKRGESVVVFPEGTFVRSPGLRPFHLGAFVAAAESAAPVVPVTIRGTRSILRDGSWFPRRGTVRVVVSAPLRASASGWTTAVQLRERARRAILAHCGEPDLEASP